MGLTINSKASGVGSTSKNVQFVPTANNVPSRIVIIGTYDPTLIVDDNVPQRIFSASDASVKYGRGFMIHRLAIQAELGAAGIETWVVPQPELGGSAAAVGNLDFAGSTAIQAGNLALYIAGISATTFIVQTDTAQSVATKVVEKLNDARLDLPVTAAIDGTVDTKVNITAKSKGLYGNDITLRFNIKAGEELPAGIVVAVTDMVGGSGEPDIQDALDALGIDDDKNEAFFTELVHGYGQFSAALGKIAIYVGLGNDFVGLYSKLVGRPFRSLVGNAAPGTIGLDDLLTFTGMRKLDRGNGAVAIPGSANHPTEIAAQALGHMARINNNRAAESYVGTVLIGIDPGAKADRWTVSYDNRDLAVKNGVSPTRVQNGVVVLQNVMSFYRPDDVPEQSNGYRSMRNISIVRNIISNIRKNFEREAWRGISIVEAVEKVTNLVDRQKSRDREAVLNDLLALTELFEGRAWIYTADFTVEGLRDPSKLVLRPDGSGFDGLLPVILSGEGGILDFVTEFDVSLAAVTVIQQGG